MQTTRTDTDGHGRTIMVIAAVVVAVLLGGLDAPGLEAGAAKVDITPPIGTPLNGYGDRLGRNSVGIHDALWSRCLYLSDGETGIFFVNLDLCYVNRPLRARVLELAPDAVPKEHIILTATHTHNGPGAMEDRIPFRIAAGRFIPEVLEDTARKIVQSMNDAYNARKRAAIGYGTAKQTALSVNRRINGGPIDEQIGVIRVDDSDGNAIAIIANFAAHPTSVPAFDHYSFSCDYPGFYYSTLENLTNPGCVAMFTNGAEGDQRTANPENKEGWERIEAVGRLLAGRVKEVCNGMTCGEGRLHVSWATARLPRTLATTIHPEEVFLQTLEINDLLLTFFPGEPCVNIGLEMRRRALARGYAAQFSVGLSNDFLNYFVPRDTYARLDYECSMNFFGPAIEDWFYREFGKLMTRGNADADLELPEVPKVEEVDSGWRVAYAGPPYAVGYQRGVAFRDALQQRYTQKVLRRVQSGEVFPHTGLWGWSPPFLDLTPLALPVLGTTLRPLLEGASPSLMSELEGMAAGAELPFDAVWLSQNVSRLAETEDKSALFAAPFCTMIAAVGDRAGADELIVGRNLDWSGTEEAVISEIRTEGDCAYVQAGFAWNAGVFTGTNDAGVVVAAERVQLLGDPPLKGQPIEMVLRDVLSTATDFENALTSLRAAKHVRGYHVLLAGFTAGEAAAAVIEYGREQNVRLPEDGLLLGVDPLSPQADAEIEARYARALGLLSEERIIERAEMQRVLADASLAETGRARIWNEDTRHSVVFEPVSGAMHTAFRNGEGQAGAYTTITLPRTAPRVAADTNTRPGAEAGKSGESQTRRGAVE